MEVVVIVAELIELLSQQDPNKLVVMEYEGQYNNITVVRCHTVLLDTPSFADYAGVEMLGHDFETFHVTTDRLSDYIAAERKEVVMLAAREP
jgi:hypothetical protein